MCAELVGEVVEGSKDDLPPSNLDDLTEKLLVLLTQLQSAEKTSIEQAQWQPKVTVEKAYIMSCPILLPFL